MRRICNALTGSIGTIDVVKKGRPDAPLGRAGEFSTAGTPTGEPERLSRPDDALFNIEDSKQTGTLPFLQAPRWTRLKER